MVASSEADSAPTRERLIGIDWLRLWAFAAIITYHASWFFWPTAGGPPDPFPTPYWIAASEFAFYSSYSGFTIVFVTAFVLGLKPRVFSGKIWLPIFLLAGWVVFCVVVWIREGGSFAIAWDIYPFLLLTFVFADEALARIRGRGKWWVLGLCGALLWLPFWQLQDVLPLSDAWRMVLVGICPEDFADWPLLPWSALVFGGLALGQLYRDRPTGADLTLRNWEWFWIAGALAAFVFVNPYYHATPLGDGWTCYIFRRPVWVFWGYFAGLLAALRLCLAPGVQRFLAGHRATRFVSELAVSRRFFAAYLGHYVLLSLASTLILPAALEHRWLYDLGHFGVILGIELFTRGIDLALPKRAAAPRLEVPA